MLAPTVTGRFVKERRERRYSPLKPGIPQESESEDKTFERFDEKLDQMDEYLGKVMKVRHWHEFSLNRGDAFRALITVPGKICLDGDAHFQVRFLFPSRSQEIEKLTKKEASPEKSAEPEDSRHVISLASEYHASERHDVHAGQSSTVSRSFPGPLQQNSMGS